jgi:hypothetical protein
VTAFIFSIVVTAVLVGFIVQMARRRPPGMPLSWGEAFIGGAFIFFILLMIYGVVPNQWMRWADNELKWRSDKLGIPMGPLGSFLHSQFGWGKNNVLFGPPKGINFFGRGKIEVSAKILEDIVATGIYGVALVGHILMWMWWQGRAKRAATQPAIERKSAYGRPLVRST